MNCPPVGIVMRIRYQDGAMDWNVERPDMITFENTLEAIKQVCADVSEQAFDYEDEDGDLITVRSEEEIRTMLQHYYKMYGMDCEPLVIYPHVGKASCERNIEGLKVKTKSESHSAPSAREMTSEAAMTVDDLEETSMEQDPGSSSSRKTSGDIHEILACGHIGDSDVEIIDILGSGNCGTVYKALHRTRRSPMAVKIIPVDCTPEARKQIIAELEILYRCKTPAIISFYGAYFMDSRIHICTEYMDGGSLDLYGKIPEDILGRIAVSIVKGLQYLWSLKIMHRDVKPSNVLVNTDGQVKLCDFGVSVQLVESIAKTFVGTNAYMAPEKIGGNDYRVQSEVWSFGISLFEMAVGRFPYESANKNASKPLELLQSIVGKMPPQLPRGEFSDSFVNFVANCMQKAPNARPAPEALLKHPFIEKYNDNNVDVVAAWVRMKLVSIFEKRKLAKKQ